MSDYSAAFQRGFAARHAEFNSRTKSAGIIGKPLVTAGKAIFNAGKSLLPSAERAGKSLVSGAEDPGMMSRLGNAATRWTIRNPGKALGAAAGVTGASSLAAGLGVANHAENVYRDQAGNMMQGLKNTGQEYLNGMGGNSFMGRLMMMLNYLFGGNHALEGLRNGFMNYAAHSRALSPLNQSILAKQVAPPVAAPAAPAPTAAPAATAPTK